MELSDSLVDIDDIDVVQERREYGEVLSREIATPSASSNKERVEVTQGADTHLRYYESTSPPGANEEVIKVVWKGDTVAESSYNVIRIVVNDMNILSPGGSDSQDVEPPEIYPIHDISGHPTLVIGEQVWDDRRLDFGTGVSRGWTTDSDAQIVERAFDTLRSDLGDVVKIVDPYLGADDLIDFVEDLDSDQEVWFITSELRNQSKVEKKLRNFESSGRVVEILRIMDDDGGPGGTPLHDRFIVSGQKRSWILGTSFNTLGANVSVISELPPRVTKSLDRQFNQWWTESVMQKSQSKKCNKQYLGTSTI